jgi:hypothetical protein
MRSNRFQIRENVDQMQEKIKSATLGEITRRLDSIATRLAAIERKLDARVAVEPKP